MIVDGIVLGSMGFAAGYWMFKRLPARIQKILTKYDLVLEVVATYGTYILHGDTLVGLTAAAWTCVLVALCLHLRRNKAEYAWLFEAIEEAKRGCASALSWAKECVEAGRAVPREPIQVQAN